MVFSVASCAGFLQWSSVWEPQNGVYRCPIGQNTLGDLLVVSYMFKVCYGIFGVYIFPKWLIKVPSHIPILFR